MIDQSTFLFNLPLFSRSKSSLLKQIEVRLQTGKNPLLIFTPNPEQVVQSLSNKSFGNNLRTADVLIPDGVGLVLASRLLAMRTGQRQLQERITGSDLVVDILANSRNMQTLILGGRGYGNKKLPVGDSQCIIGESPLSWSVGYNDVTNQLAEEEQGIVVLLKELRPSIVFVAFGAPHQEAWIVAHKQLLQEAGVKVVMSVGGAFDMLLGLVPRAPLWMQRAGLEWLFRLVQQPWRWHRQLRLLEFIRLVFREFMLPRRR